MRTRLLAAILFGALLAMPAVASADSVAKWRTPEGTLYFGDRPPPGSVLIERREMREQPGIVSGGGSGRRSSSSEIHGSGRVTHVDDGDTFEMTAPGGEIRVRLYEIDAPEHDQPYGPEAKEALSDLIYDKSVRVDEVDRDPYGRVVARVHLGGVDVNAEMVHRGAAWVYRKFARGRSLYAFEDAARNGHRGLWALPESSRVPPWEWRREERRGQTTEQPAAPPVAKQGPVIGNPRSMIYHRPDCPDYAKVSPRTRVLFGAPAAAEAAGYRRAGNCP